jgi:head-tail adaptor
MAAPVPSGMLRLSLTVQNPVRTVDAFGQAVEAWVTIGTVWAHVEASNTTEVMDDGGPAVRTEWRIIASWLPSLTSRSRLLWNDNGTTRTFNCRACWDMDQRRRRLEIEAVEVTE